MKRHSVSEANVKKMPRRQRERIQRRADILQSAEGIFAEKGFHAASIEEIARAAEYAAGTVYLYFKDKEALYIELFEDKIRALGVAIQEQTSTAKDPIRALTMLVQARMEYFEQNRRFFSIYAREGMNLFENRDDRWCGVVRLYEEYLGMLARLIQSGQRKRLFRKGNPREFAIALSGMMMHLTRDVLGGKDKKPLTERTQFVLSLFLEGVRVS